MGVGPNVWVIVGVMDGRKGDTSVFVGFGVSKWVGVKVLSWAGRAAVIRGLGAMVVAMAVGGDWVGVYNKANTPLEIGDQKKMIESRTARIVNKKNDKKIQKPAPRPDFFGGVGLGLGGAGSWAGGIS